MVNLKLTYGEAVYLRHILEDHIRDEKQKDTYGKCPYASKPFSFCKESCKGERHMGICNTVLDKLKYGMNDC